MASCKANIWHEVDWSNCYSYAMDTGERVRMARLRKNLSQKKLGALLKTDQGTIARIEGNRQGGQTYLPGLADALEVPLEWLTVEDNPPAWAKTWKPPKVSAGEATESAVRPLSIHKGEEAPISVVGKVTAGNGLVSYEAEPREFVWKSTWAVMQVEGNSAYPVAFENQFVIVDTHRELNHNNIVVIQVLKPGDVKHRAYVKRYCKSPDSPTGYTLASVNAGIDSPWIPPEWIIAMVPVVGVIFEE